MIDLSTATFIGPIATDDVILQTVPADYRDLLLAVNGCILFGVVFTSVERANTPNGTRYGKPGWG